MQKSGVIPFAVDGGDITYGDPFPSLPDLVQSMTMPHTLAKLHHGPGVVTLNELVAGIENGAYSAHNADYQESWRLIKEWSRYWQRGFAGTSNAGALFLKGQAAMYFVGAYNVPTVESSVPKGHTFGWDVFPLPQITPASSPFATAEPKNVGVWGAWGSGAYCITYVAQKRGNVDLARDFLFFLSAPRQAATVSISDGFLPIYAEVPIKGSNPLETRLYEKFNDVMQHPCALATAQTALGPALQLKRTKVLQSYLTGQISLDAAMGEMQSAFTRAARTARRWLSAAGEK